MKLLLLFFFTFIYCCIFQQILPSNVLPHFLFGKPARSTFLEYGERIHYGNIFGIDSLDKFDKLQNDADCCPDVKVAYFKNKIDHFNLNDTRTWNQRYQYNSKHFVKSNTSDVVFIMIGGEGAASPIWVQKETYQYIKMAIKHSAYIYQLEHRFFGESQPFKDTGSMAFENLKYLTPKQALADLDNFINSLKNNFTNPRVVVFGGSYPGGLAAIYRLKYPSSTVGAIASSAGINLQVDYTGYSLGMEETINATDPNCYNVVNASFNALQQATLTKDGRSKLNQLFNLQPSFNETTFTKLDLTNFLANVFAVFQGIIQYTYDGREIVTENNYTVKTLCDYMTRLPNPNGFDNIAGIVKWSNKVNGLPSNAPFSNSYSDMINGLRMTDYSAAKNNSNVQNNLEGRGWMWLCCNGLGFFQTTDEGRNIFHSIIPLNFFINQCEDIFDPSINNDYVQKAVQNQKEYYGDADTYQGTNVVLPNGEFDPWKRVGVFINDTNKNLYSFIIPGSAHCSDMYPEYKNEPVGLANAREFIYSQVDYYLNSSLPHNTKPSTKSTSKISHTFISSFISLLIFFLPFLLI
ncbi:Peptidase S28 family-containing protein [Strongyloides ratti]|uniref:Peptidase S28 family-containing protein n=1 Tax=Strongyloides ratti TaxID=34506 RepID=A0A090N093_STRRB|nr:Peptidase S28 family-containing protein [Strongyloides ratti]CEF70285.1 Peptidase S28 family-containing protein [Strongyloides ratti]